MPQQHAQRSKVKLIPFYGAITVVRCDSVRLQIQRSSADAASRVKPNPYPV